MARSLAQVLSQNHMIYEFGPDEKIFSAIGGGTLLGMANPFIVLLVLTVDLHGRLALHVLGTLGVCASAATSRRRG